MSDSNERRIVLEAELLEAAEAYVRAKQPGGQKVGAAARARAALIKAALRFQRD